MSENLHDIDKLFRDAIEGHEDMPGEKVWDAVDAGLDKSNVVHIKRKYNNLKRIAAVLLLLLLTVVGYEIFKPATAGKDVAGNGTLPAQNAVTDKTNSSAAGNTAAADKSGMTPQPQNNDTINGSSRQANSVANAGYDSLHAAAQATDNTPQNSKTAKVPVPNKITTGISTAADNSNSTVNTDTDAAAAVKKKQRNGAPVTGTKSGADEDAANKTTGNKSFKNKTKIKVKSPLPQQYEDDSISAEGDATVVKATVTGELPPLENTRVSTLAERINKAVAANEIPAVNRRSPETVIKKLNRPKSFHFNLMPYFSPQFASSSLKEESHGYTQTSSAGGPPPPRPGRDNHKEQYKDDEQTQTAYTAGLAAEIPLSKKWSIQSGISYTQKNIRIEPKKIYARADKDGKVKYVFDCSSGYSYISAKTGATPVAGDSIAATSSKNTLGYIGVPLSVNYKFSLGKFSILPSFGTVLNFLAKQKIETALVQGTAKEPQTISKIEGLKSSYFTATTGVAFEYNVNKRVAVNIMPSGNFALTSINKDAAVQSYPNAFGVAGGLKIKF